MTAIRNIVAFWNREQLADELARLGWTVEFAPAEWLIGHVHELASAGIDPADLRADALTHGPALATAANTVLAAWLDGIAVRT